MPPARRVVTPWRIISTDVPLGVPRKPIRRRPAGSEATLHGPVRGRRNLAAPLVHRASTHDPQGVHNSPGGSPQNRARALDVGVADGRIPQHVVFSGLDWGPRQAYIRPVVLAARRVRRAARTARRRTAEAAQEATEDEKERRIGAGGLAAIVARCQTPDPGRWEDGHASLARQPRHGPATPDEHAGEIHQRCRK
jgi:hypothetical protein